MSNYKQVVGELGYSGSPNYVTDPDMLPAAGAHLLRAARAANVRGAYLFRTAPAYELPKRPAVYVAEAVDERDAQRIHRLIWNQGAVPYIIVIMPGQVRVYSGFRYEKDSDSFLDAAPTDDLGSVRDILADYFAEKIDNGLLWARVEKLKPQYRVDLHLLRNLEALGNYLVVSLELSPETAHALIGKYLYIRYLLDRGILSNAWLDQCGINIDEVIGPQASVAGLSKLVALLEKRFNGKVFPLPLHGPEAPSEQAVSSVAAVFGGLEIHTGQLPLDFQIYDFSYIPVELLSCIYEQFLHREGKGAGAGAYYTPEPVADYLLAEINSQRPLSPTSRILDPCCGSGVFLVLAYRLLIEAARADDPKRKMEPEELRAIMEQRIFGVERNREACYVAEFSLILTMLGYIEPPDLHQNNSFEFPRLHNRNIFQADFFDLESVFAKSGLVFEWIVGNPPWQELSTKPENWATLEWIKENREVSPVARSRASEAFLWRVCDVLAPGGMVALLVHATSLTNAQSHEFRREFFRKNNVRRITNFSNLAYSLFSGSAEAPAATIVYHPDNEIGRSPIVHYGPFAANQALTRSSGNARPWVITIFEDEISSVPQEEAAKGESRTWKLALWGTYRDVRTLERIGSKATSTLGELAKRLNWDLTLGLQLRDGRIPEEESEPYDFVPQLVGQKIIDKEVVRKLSRRFSLPKRALSPIPEHMCYVRTGRTNGLKFLRAPHLWIDVNLAVFSDQNFVLCHPLIGLSGSPESEGHLRALSIYLNSSLAHYIQFFETSSWGIDRRRINKGEISGLRVPDLDGSQVEKLAALHKELVAIEEGETDLFWLDVGDLQERVDQAVFEVVGLSSEDATAVVEFFKIRLALDKGKKSSAAMRQPSEADLRSYALLLRDELDEYAGLRHNVMIFAHQEFIVCEVRTSESDVAVPPRVAVSRDRKDEYEAIWKLIRDDRSQWVYVQRGLRLFDGSRVILCKPARLIDWTLTRAMHDSDDIVSEILSALGVH